MVVLQMLLGLLDFVLKVSTKFGASKKLSGTESLLTKPHLVVSRTMLVSFGVLRTLARL